jgi:hypothetical protein
VREILASAGLSLIATPKPTGNGHHGPTNGTGGGKDASAEDDQPHATA